ncbi:MULTISPECIES: 2OG-Fe(II) oxygenase family protein [Micrococcaceae]|uniref:2OG-Fe(II) oxygenase family protein n=1 Tax=Micrococcaceae TaxID=1268 RepID=UPI0009F182ED
MARYRPGHYLRRHDDVFDGRVSATVFFLHTTWDESYGTHLVAENWTADLQSSLHFLEPTR